jgi:glyoxylase-like metal-dependent hydrolase (beta-lactamase superfamily II)
MEEKRMHQSEDNKFLPMTSVAAGKGREIRPDVYYYTNQIVNLVFIGNPDDRKWVLIDSGMPGSGKKILRQTEERFPLNSRPSAILLTHGHFDHVGSIVRLIEEWETPVYAHPLEFPFLNGQKAYPDPDTTVEGGMVAKMSAMFPHEPVDISPALVELPPDGTIPDLPGWRWIHTPGHTPGHVSFFRESDRTLIAGDAFVTVRTDMFYKVLFDKTEVNGPPRYLTTDWNAAWESVKKLEALQPEYVVTGHGTAMQGDELRKGLKKLVNEFDTIAIPDHGKYVD